jgi:uncharacterized protein DUF5117
MKMLPQLGFVLLLPFLMLAGVAQAADAPPAIADVVAGADRQEGYFDFYYQPNTGQILLEVERWNEEFLYASALATGIGSNDIGLDRGQLGGGRVVKFERHGNKVFLKHINLDYRAVSDSAAERLSVQEAFAESILAGFAVEAVEGNRVLIDLTDFLLSDVHGVATTLARSQQL